MQNTIGCRSWRRTFFLRPALRLWTSSSTSAGARAGELYRFVRCSSLSRLQRVRCWCEREFSSKLMHRAPPMKHFIAQKERWLAIWAVFRGPKCLNASYTWFGIFVLVGGYLAYFSYGSIPRQIFPGVFRNKNWTASGAKQGDHRHCLGHRHG